jgi:hypothetical protein
VNVKGSGDVRNGFAFQNKPTCQLFLICAQFSRVTESYTSFLGSFSSCTCSLSYHVSLKHPLCGAPQNDDAERAIMQSHTAEVAVWPAVS